MSRCRSARRLVKVGIAAAAQSEGAVHSAVRHAKEAGILDSEIRHVIVLSFTTIGFPRAMAAMSWGRRRAAKVVEEAQGSLFTSFGVVRSEKAEKAPACTGLTSGTA